MWYMLWKPLKPHQIILSFFPCLFQSQFFFCMLKMHKLLNKPQSFCSLLHGKLQWQCLIKNMRFLKHMNVEAFNDKLKFKGSVGFVSPPILVKLEPKQNTNIFKFLKFWLVPLSPSTLMKYYCKSNSLFEISDLTYDKKKPSFEKCQILQ
jgi:hypothetical protein